MCPGYLGLIPDTEIISSGLLWFYIATQWIPMDNPSVKRYSAADC